MPNVFDALKMMQTVQSKMSQKTVINCWLKCDIFTETQSEQLKQLLRSHQPTSDSNDDALSCDEITAALSNLKLNMDSNNNGYQVKSNETVFTSAIVAIKETQELLLNAGNKESTARVLDDWCAIEESREFQQHLLLELTEDEQIENISSEDQVEVIGDEKESPLGELRNVVQALQDLPSYVEGKIASNRRTYHLDKQQSTSPEHFPSIGSIVGNNGRCAARVSILFSSASKVCATRQRCKDEAIDHSPRFS